MLTVSLQGGTLIFSRGEETVLRVTPQPQENAMVLQLSGQVLSDTAYPLQDELESYLSLDIPIRLDYSQVTFLSASAQEMLLNVQKLSEDSGRGELKLCSVPDSVYMELEHNNMTEHLYIEM